MKMLICSIIREREKSQMIKGENLPVSKENGHRQVRGRGNCNNREGGDDHLVVVKKKKESNFKKTHRVPLLHLRILARGRALIFPQSHD